MSILKLKTEFNAARTYKVNALKKKISREKSWSRRQFTWFRAVLLERNMVVRAVRDVKLTEIEKKDTVGGTFYEFEYDGSRYHPHVEHMIYDKGIRYGFFMVGFTEQASFDVLEGDNGEPVIKIDLPEMDSETYLHRQQLGFVSALISAGTAMSSILKSLTWQFFMNIIEIAILVFIALKVFGAL